MRPYCPRDTNGDGDCGRSLCPYCGRYRMQVLYPLVCQVAAAMAADVWDEKTVVQHADDVARRELVNPEFPFGALVRLIAEQLDFAGHDDGSYTPITYLEAVHQVQGMSHLRMVEHLRDLAAEIDPKADERTYGKARDIPRVSSQGNLE